MPTIKDPAELIDRRQHARAEAKPKRCRHEWQITSDHPYVDRCAHCGAEQDIRTGKKPTFQVTKSPPP